MVPVTHEGSDQGSEASEQGRGASDRASSLWPAQQGGSCHQTLLPGEGLGVAVEGSRDSENSAPRRAWREGTLVPGPWGPWAFRPPLHSPPTSAVPIRSCGR